MHWAEIGTTLFPKKQDIEAKKHTSWSGGKMYAPGIHKQRAIGKAVGSLDHRKCGGHFLQPIAKTIFHLPSLLPFSVVGKLGGIRREYLEFCPYFTCMLWSLPKVSLVLKTMSETIFCRVRGFYAVCMAFLFIVAFEIIKFCPLPETIFPASFGILPTLWYIHTILANIPIHTILASFKPPSRIRSLRIL